MKKLIATTILSLGLTSQAWSQDFLGDIMQGSLATLDHARQLIYYSFFYSENSGSQQTQKTSEKDVDQFLAGQGMELPRTDRPILKKEFAKLIMERYHFKTSWLTNITRQPVYYFEDARKLGLFAPSSRAEETMSPTELIQVYKKANSMAVK